MLHAKNVQIKLQGDQIVQVQNDMKMKNDTIGRMKEGNMELFKLQNGKITKVPGLDEKPEILLKLPMIKRVDVPLMYVRKII